MAERTPSPGRCSRNGTCLTHGSKARKPTECCFALPNPCFQGWLPAQVLVDPEFVGKGQLQRYPPFPLVESKRLAWGWIKMVSLQNAVQTMPGLGSRLYQSGAVRHQRAQGAHVLRRHPHRGHELGRQ